MQMQIYVINLDTDTEKMSFIDAQLKRLGVAYARVSAVYGKDLPRSVYRAAYSPFRWWCAVGRPIIPAEIGCALSHAGIYKNLKPGEAACILEDDVIIDEAFIDRLRAIEHDIDTSKPQVYFLSDHQHHFDGLAGIVHRDDAMCTDGYVITKPAAEAVLNINFPMIVPCDHWVRWAKAGLLELYHALPATVRQHQERFGTSTQAGAVDVASYPLPKWILHKSKRLIGKTIDELLWRMGK